MNPNDHIQPSIRAHSTVRLKEPVVRPIDGYPNNYVVDFGDLTIHTTPERWRDISAAVERGLFEAHFSRTEAAS